MSQTKTQARTRPAGEHRRVEINRSSAIERYRYVCPNGHVNWDRTNNHIWCRQCRRACDAGEDLDPEHYHILDKKREELIPWEQVRIADSEEP